MLKRFQKFLESLVFAGLRPGASSAPQPAGKVSRLFGGMYRSVVAPGISALYVGNLTFAQRARRLLLLVVPLLAVAGVVVLGIFYFAAKRESDVPLLTNAEVAEKILPNFDSNITVEANKSLEVSEVTFEHGASSVMRGSLQNKSGRAIAEAVVVLDLTNDEGSQLGGVTITERNLAPDEVRRFEQSINQHTATHSVVRSVRTR